jgi:hypothetical protein
VEHAFVDGIQLEYEVTGTGEPVLLIHGAFVADSFRPFLAEPKLAGDYQFDHLPPAWVRWQRRDDRSTPGQC